MKAEQSREAWNKGKLVGQKPPLRLKDVWAMNRRILQRGNSLDQIVRHAVFEILAPDEDMNMGSMRCKKHNGLSC